MSYNKQKMGRLIVNECESIEEKCNGYRKEVRDTILEILTVVRDHQAQRTTIQKQINQACHKAGDFLHRNRDRDTPTTEVPQ